LLASLFTLLVVTTSAAARFSPSEVVDGFFVALAALATTGIILTYHPDVKIKYRQYAIPQI